jgi:hypothetical protein
MARGSALSESKNALYTSIAAVSFAALVVGAQCVAASAVKKDPTIQTYHLFGIGVIWLAGFCLFLITLLLAWIRYRSVPHEERAAHPAVREATAISLMLSFLFLAYEAIRIVSVHLTQSQ